MRRDTSILAGCLIYLLVACGSEGDQNGAATQNPGEVTQGMPTAQPGTPGAQPMPGPGSAGSAAPGAPSNSGQPDTGSMAQPIGSAGTTGSEPANNAGTGGETPMTTAGTAGPAPQAGTGGSDATPAGDAPPCLTDMKQLGIAGDSYIDWVSHDFPGELAKLGGAEGVWDTIPGRGGSMYAVGGTAILTGQIPGQVDSLLQDLPDLKVIVMDGGGNDVLLNATAQQCKATGSSTDAVCQQIVADTLDASEQMYMRMAAAGVEDVVFFFYPEVPNNTLLGGPNPNEISSYARPMVEEACASALERTGVRCHFVDMVPVFEGHPDYFAPGDLHPSLAGGVAMAEALWAKMVDDCVGQQPSSGCCRQ